MCGAVCEEFRDWPAEVPLVAMEVAEVAGYRACEISSGSDRLDNEGGFRTLGLTYVVECSRARDWGFNEAFVIGLSTKPYQLDRY